MIDIDKIASEALKELSALVARQSEGHLGDYEDLHIEADEVLLRALSAMGLTAIVQEYEKIDKHYA